MATASAVATPASPDISMPSTPSELSSANRPLVSAMILRKEVTESPGRAAAWAAPLRIGEVMFIAITRAQEAPIPVGTENRCNQCGLVTAMAIVVQRGAAVLLRGAGAVAIAGLALRPRGKFDVDPDGLAAGFRAGGAHLRAAAGDGRD